LVVGAFAPPTVRKSCRSNETQLRRRSQRVYMKDLIVANPNNQPVTIALAEVFHLD
jgi:L-rhamnose mutarotase